jgi:hypothetical protein
MMSEFVNCGSYLEGCEVAKRELRSLNCDALKGSWRTSSPDEPFPLFH